MDAHAEVCERCTPPRESPLEAPKVCAYRLPAPTTAAATAASGLDFYHRLNQLSLFHRTRHSRDPEISASEDEKCTGASSDRDDALRMAPALHNTSTFPTSESTLLLSPSSVPPKDSSVDQQPRGGSPLERKTVLSLSDIGGSSREADAPPSLTPCIRVNLRGGEGERPHLVQKTDRRTHVEHNFLKETRGSLSPSRQPTTFAASVDLDSSRYLCNGEHDRALLGVPCSFSKDSCQGDSPGHSNTSRDATSVHDPREATSANQPAALAEWVTSKTCEDTARAPSTLAEGYQREADGPYTSSLWTEVAAKSFSSSQRPRPQSSSFAIRARGVDVQPVLLRRPSNGGVRERTAHARELAGTGDFMDEGAPAPKADVDVLTSAVGELTSSLHHMQRCIHQQQYQHNALLRAYGDLHRKVTAQQDTKRTQACHLEQRASTVDAVPQGVAPQLLRGKAVIQRHMSYPRTNMLEAQHSPQSAPCPSAKAAASRRGPTIALHSSEAAPVPLGLFERQPISAPFVALAPTGLRGSPAKQARRVCPISMQLPADVGESMHYSDIASFVQSDHASAASSLSPSLLSENSEQLDPVLPFHSTVLPVRGAILQSPPPSTKPTPPNQDAFAAPSLKMTKRAVGQWRKAIPSTALQNFFSESRNHLRRHQDPRLTMEDQIFAKLQTMPTAIVPYPPRQYR